MQGFDNDESDSEWDSDIREEFGTRGGGHRRNERLLDVGMNMDGLVQHTFHIYDGIAASIRNADNRVGGQSVHDTDRRYEDGGEAVDGPREHGVQQPRSVNDKPAHEAPEGDEEMEEDDLPAMQDMPPSRAQLLEDSARTPLFAGSGLTQLGGTLLLLNCLRMHGASNLLVNEIFAILNKSMLPTLNSLPPNEYHASKVLKQLGLAYETIHCCPGPRTCILFRGEEYKDLTRCPVCNAERFKRVGKSQVPIKVLRHQGFLFGRDLAVLRHNVGTSRRFRVTTGRPIRSLL